MALLNNLTDELKAAMRAKDTLKLEALRAIKSAVLLAKTASAGDAELPEEEEIKLLQKLVKQRKDSALIFREQNRDDLATPEEAQAEVIAKFLPEQLTTEAIEKIIDEVLDDDKKDEIEYTILEIQYHDQNSYKTAFNTAQGISGKNRSSALKIAAQCVANMANGCGSSTFERKANYLYAAQIADRAGDSSAAAKYRAAGPTESDWFEAGVSSVTLSCWGVIVSK